MKIIHQSIFLVLSLGLLYGQPTITGVALAGDNTTIAVTFSEAVYNTNGGSGALETSDFSFSISGGTATLSSTTPTSIAASGNTYTLGIDLSGTPDGSEVLTVNPVDDEIYDAVGNEASTDQSPNNTATLNDQLVPTLTEQTPVTALDNDPTPTYIFRTSEAGIITYGGSASSVITDATAGDNTITFSTLLEQF